MIFDGLSAVFLLAKKNDCFVIFFFKNSGKALGQRVATYFRNFGNPRKPSNRPSGGPLRWPRRSVCRFLCWLEFPWRCCFSKLNTESYYGGSPQKTRFWEGVTFPGHAVADFRKKVPPTECSRYLTEKVVKRGSKVSPIQTMLSPILEKNKVRKSPSKSKFGG